MSLLTHLSLLRAKPGRFVPHVPTAEDRLREYRAATAPMIGNAHVWPYMRPKAVSPHNVVPLSRRRQK